MRSPFPIIVCIILFSPALFSQSAVAAFGELSRPEKLWVITHLFKAKKALAVSKQVQKDVDSVRRAGHIGSDISGGALDAFKHAYWMAALGSRIGARKALRLGKAHEKGNYLQFRKSEKEDEILPDSAGCAMDIHNNRMGASLLKEGKADDKLLQQKVLKLLREGKLLVLRKDADGHFISCEGERIRMDLYAGKWSNPKCLVPSFIP